MRSLARVLLLSLVVSAAACGDDDGGPPEQASITVQNRSAQTIAFVFIADCAVATWGNDRLGATEVIAPNANRAFSVDPGCWDARAETAGGSAVERAAIELDEGENFNWTINTF
jgi:hypothetical protein